MAVYGKQQAIEEISREVFYITNHNSKGSLFRLSEIMVDAAALSKHKNMTEETIMFWQNIVNRIDDVLNKRMKMIKLKQSDIRKIQYNQERSFTIILSEK